MSEKPGPGSAPRTIPWAAELPTVRTVFTPGPPILLRPSATQLSSSPSNILQTAVTTVQRTATMAINAVENTATTAVNAVEKTATTAVNAVEKTATTVVSQAARGLSSVGNSIRNAFRF